MFMEDGLNGSVKFTGFATELFHRTGAGRRWGGRAFAAARIELARIIAVPELAFAISGPRLPAAVLLVSSRELR